MNGNFRAVEFIVTAPKDVATKDLYEQTFKNVIRVIKDKKLDNIGEIVIETFDHCGCKELIVSIRRSLND